jgi:hypothetical protein
MLTAVAIDAGWLRELDNQDEDEFFLRMRFLTELRTSRVVLLLDVDDHIRAEYERVLPVRSNGSRFVRLMVNRGIVGYYSGSPSSRCGRCLDEDGFDASDRPYVGVAQAASAPYLTHETKHLNQRRVDLVQKHCGVLITAWSGINQLL